MHKNPTKIHKLLLVATLALLCQVGLPQAVESTNFVQTSANYPRITSIGDTASTYMVSHTSLSDGFITRGFSIKTDLGVVYSTQEIDDLDCDPGSNQCVANADGKRVIVFTGPQPRGAFRISVTSKTHLNIKYVQSFPNSNYYFVGYARALHTIQRVHLTNTFNYYSYASNNLGERRDLKQMKYIKGSKYIVGIFDGKTLWHDVTADRANATKEANIMNGNEPTGVDFIQKSQRLVISDAFRKALFFLTFPAAGVERTVTFSDDPLGVAAYESSDFFALLTSRNVKIYQYSTTAGPTLLYTLSVTFSSTTTSVSPLTGEPGMKFSRALGSVAFWMGKDGKLTHHGKITVAMTAQRKNPSCGAAENPSIAFSNFGCGTCAVGLQKFAGVCHYHVGDVNYPYFSRIAGVLPSKTLSEEEIVGKITSTESTNSDKENSVSLNPESGGAFVILLLMFCCFFLCCAAIFCLAKILVGRGGPRHPVRMSAQGKSSGGFSRPYRNPVRVRNSNNISLVAPSTNNPSMFESQVGPAPMGDNGMSFGGGMTPAPSFPPQQPMSMAKAGVGVNNMFVPPS